MAYQGSTFCQSINEAAWKHWEDHDASQYDRGEDPIPTVNVQEHIDDLLPYLETTFGGDWKKRPLLLQGLWSQDELNNSRRRFSVSGLLREGLVVPYFSDARKRSALSPDGRAPISDIMTNITRHGAPHKIGTQLLVQAYPDLIQEIAPMDIVTELFGSYFSPQSVRGSGPFGLFPPMTTVPIFVASGRIHAPYNTSGMAEAKRRLGTSESTMKAQNPFTALHCEPIGNVAVQLSGQKQWTLVHPDYSFLLKPTVSPDGRAFFASWATDLTHIPRYKANTTAGDAIWVPTWTWHRVDYIASDEIANGGRYFTFDRPTLSETTRFLDF